MDFLFERMTVLRYFTIVISILLLGQNYCQCCLILLYANHHDVRFLGSCNG